MPQLFFLVKVLGCLWAQLGMLISREHLASVPTIPGYRVGIADMSCSNLLMPVQLPMWAILANCGISFCLGNSC